MDKNCRHDIYLKRCYQLARMATNAVLTNPNVGAVLVHKDTIIGEGYHERYGEGHAEVNAVASVKEENKHLISASTLYVSLEPCCHHGKTPPCVDLIRKHNIPRVHIGCLDPSDKVAGKGVKILRDSGIEVVIHNSTIAQELIAPFVVHNGLNRPYISIKYAQSKNFYMGIENQNYWISNSYTGVHAHQLRSRHDAILVGTKTALVDDPSLSTRSHPGPSPHKLVIDKKAIIPPSAALFKDAAPTIFTSDPEASERYHEFIPDTDDFIDHILLYCMKHKYARILIEGGKKTIQSFISRDLWDQAYVYTSANCIENPKAIKSPRIQGRLLESYRLDDNTVYHIKNGQPK